MCREFLAIICISVSQSATVNDGYYFIVKILKIFIFIPDCDIFFYVKYAETVAFLEQIFLLVWEGSIVAISIMKSKPRKILIILNKNHEKNCLIDFFIFSTLMSQF